MNLPFVTVSMDSKVIETTKLNREVTTIGRTSDNDIVINNLSVSRCHAMVFIKGGKMTLKDMGSVNGTFVNGTRVDEVELSIGDSILIGKHTIKIDNGKDIVSRDIDFSSGEGTVIMDAQSRDKFLQKLEGDEAAGPTGPPRLILSESRELKIKSDLLTIGKGDNADVIIGGFLIKDSHSIITKQENGSYRIINMGSFFKPTKVNGKRIREKTLGNGDVIEIGSHKLIFIL